MASHSGANSNASPIITAPTTFRRTCHLRHSSLPQRTGQSHRCEECPRWQSRAQPFKAVAPVRRQATARPISAVTSVPTTCADRADRATLGSRRRPGRPGLRAASGAAPGAAPVFSGRSSNRPLVQRHPEGGTLASQDLTTSSPQQKTRAEARVCKVVLKRRVTKRSFRRQA